MSPMGNNARKHKKKGINDHNFRSRPTSTTMNNKIINVKDMPDFCEEGRRIQTMAKEDTMTTHCRGTGVAHEIKGRDNFRIVHMSDGNGNTVPEGKIKTTHMWC